MCLFAELAILGTQYFSYVFLLSTTFLFDLLVRQIATIIAVGITVSINMKIESRSQITVILFFFYALVLIEISNYFFRENIKDVKTAEIKVAQKTKQSGLLLRSIPSGIAIVNINSKSSCPIEFHNKKFKQMFPPFD